MTEIELAIIICVAFFFGLLIGLLIGSSDPRRGNRFD